MLRVEYVFNIYIVSESVSIIRVKPLNSGWQHQGQQ